MLKALQLAPLSILYFKMKKNYSHPKQYLLSVIVVVSSLSFGILLFENILSWYSTSIAQSSKMDSGLMGYHYKLGWSLSPSWSGHHEHHDFEVMYSTNRDGLRFQPDFLDTKAKKVAVLGDSFTFGYGVNDNETFTNKLNDLNHNYSFLNYGVPGYSTDQEYLLLKELLKDKTISQYVIVFYLGNDLLDNALPHPLQAEPAKPFFIMDNDELKLKNYPVPKVRKSALLRKQSLNSIVYGRDIISSEQIGFLINLLSDSEIFKWIYSGRVVDPTLDINSILDKNLKKQKALLKHLMVAIKSEIRQKKIDVSFVLLPGKSYVNEPDSYSYFFQEYVRQFVVQVANNLEITTIDLASQLVELDKEDKKKLYYPNEGHLTVFGHQKVRELLQENLLKGL